LEEAAAGKDGDEEEGFKQDLDGDFMADEEDDEDDGVVGMYLVQPGNRTSSAVGNSNFCGSL
jgi:hypothetical protein